MDLDGIQEVLQLDALLRTDLAAHYFLEKLFASFLDKHLYAN